MCLTSVRHLPWPWGPWHQPHLIRRSSRTERRGSTRDVTARVLRWLQEEIPPATPVSQITHDQMRVFRNCLLELGRGRRGKKLPFGQRLAMQGQPLLNFVTRQRYWRFATKFFGWLQAEYRVLTPRRTCRSRAAGTS